MNSHQKANIKKAQEIAQRFVSNKTKDLPANKILTHQIETACVEMANWKDALIEKFKHHAGNMYTEMMNLSTDASGIRKAMEDYRRFLFTEYYTDEIDETSSIEEQLKYASAGEEAKKLIDLLNKNKATKMTYEEWYNSNIS